MKIHEKIANWIDRGIEKQVEGRNFFGFVASDSEEWLYVQSSFKHHNIPFGEEYETTLIGLYLSYIAAVKKDV